MAKRTGWAKAEFKPLTKEAIKEQRVQYEKSFTDKIEKYQKEIRGLERKIKARRDEISEIGKAQEEKLNAREKELNEYEMSIASARAKSEEESNKLQVEKDSFKEHKEIILKSLKETDSQITRARENLDLHRIELSTNRRELDSFKDVLAKRESVIGARERALDEQTQKLIQREKEVQLKEKEASGDIRDAEERLKDLKSKESMLRAWGNELNKQDEKLVKIQTVIDSQKDEISKKQVKVDKLYSQNVQSSTDNQNKETGLIELEKELKTRNEALSYRSDKLDRRERDLRLLEQKIKEAKNA